MVMVEFICLRSAFLPQKNIRAQTLSSGVIKKTKLFKQEISKKILGHTQHLNVIRDICDKRQAVNDINISVK